MNTGKTWKTAREPRDHLLPIDRPSIYYSYFVGGPGEIVDAGKYPWGWEQPDFDDSAWGAAETMHARRPARRQRHALAMVPRAARHPADGGHARTVGEGASEPGRRRARGRAAGHRSVDHSGEVDGHRAVWIRSHLTTAYPEVDHVGRRRGHDFADLHRGAARERRGRQERHQGQPERSRGQGRHRPPGPLPARRRRGPPLPNALVAHVPVRRGDVKTADEPLAISDIRGAFTAYPLPSSRRSSSRATRSCGRSSTSAGARPGSARTRRTWTRRTGSSFSTSATRASRRIVSMYAGGDDRLVRNAIELFDESRIPDGLTQSRYPARCRSSSRRSRFSGSG